MIQPDEILARTPYPGSLGGLALVPPTTGRQQPRLLHELPVIALSADRKNAGWAHEWIARKSPSSEMKMASSGLSPSVAKALDRNADGKLDAEELVAWRETPADVSRQIRIGRNGAKVHASGRQFAKIHHAERDGHFGFGLWTVALLFETIENVQRSQSGRRWE
jgi:hypothetical protein